jgi:hypothetical protein
MKTPMQELIEWVRNHPGQTGKSLVIDKATELLEKEKEVIINTYDAGLDNGTIEQDITGEQYYKEVYEEK